MKHYDVVALGEMLIDFTTAGHSDAGNPVMEACPGGAPCNVLAMLRKLDKKCAFIGKVGQDAFGMQLTAAAEKAGIDLRGMRYDTDVHTTLAIVQTLPGGDRDFSFYRKPGADINLKVEELDAELIRDTAIFHFGTLSLTDEPCRSTTIEALRIAHEAGAIISFDPNLREPLWDDLEDARKAIDWGLQQCHILKISDNEVEFMTGMTDYDRAAALLLEKYPNIRLLNITCGADGSHAYYNGLTAFQPGCSLGGVIETTGAGDTFCACALNYVLEHGLDSLTESDLNAMLRFANTAAYIVTTRKGAICSMPEKAEVRQLLDRY